MGRTLVVLSALAAVMFSMAACACPAGGGRSGGGGGKDAACLTTCVHHRDCTACYRDESDRDMGRVIDCLPCGGSCDGCEWTSRSCEDKYRRLHGVSCDH